MKRSYGAGDALGEALGEALGRGRGLGLGLGDGPATLTVDDGLRCRQSLHAFTNRS
jgi:hypothetical protein